MDLITDGLLLAAASFAGTYCFVLARRVRALKDLDSGIGAAIMRMTHALEEARRALDEAKSASHHGNRDLRELVSRADSASGQLRMLLAATRDLPPSHAPAPAPVRQRAEAWIGRDHAPRAFSQPEAARGDRRLLEDLVPAAALAPPGHGRSPSPMERPRRTAEPRAALRRVRPTSDEDQLLAALAELAAPRRA